jgi:isopenicillin-N N-acyltransferase like protein
MSMMFESKLPPEYLAEIKSLAAASGMDERDIMLENCFLDLSPITACSSITLPADASPDHVARFGRNLDFPSYDIADKYSVVLVYHPTGKLGFLTVGWPGMIGVLSGMNERGLCLANMEVTRTGGVPHAMPYVLLYRSILENCKTTDEAIALLHSMPRQTANNLMLMDASGNRAVVELTSDAVTIRRAPDSAALISTNHQRGEDLDTPGRCKRFDYLHDTAATDFGHIDRTEIQSMLQHVQQGSYTMQSMIFEPTNRTIYLATGSHAADRQMTKIELGQFFNESSQWAFHLSGKSGRDSICTRFSSDQSNSAARDLSSRAAFSQIQGPRFSSAPARRSDESPDQPLCR